jgi:mRNA interferase HigB
MVNIITIGNAAGECWIVTNSRYVFNLKGNNYRIIVVLMFFAGELNIRFAGTHAEYNKIDAKTI